MERRGSRRESRYYGFSYEFLNHWLPREPLNEARPRGFPSARRGIIERRRRKRKKKCCIRS